MAVHKHRVNPYRSNIEISDVEAFDIFPTTVWAGKVNVDNDVILNECYSLRDKYPDGVRKSNFGGWQSDVYNLDEIVTEVELPAVSDLGTKILFFANKLCEEELNSQRMFQESGTGFWININEQFCYNVLHSHPKCDLIALYYAKINSIQGNLNLMRNDGSAHTLLYENLDNGSFFKLSAEPGVVYLFPAHILHYVEPNLVDDTRVSISFNISF